MKFLKSFRLKTSLNEEGTRWSIFSLVSSHLYGLLYICVIGVAILHNSSLYFYYWQAQVCVFVCLDIRHKSSILKRLIIAFKNPKVQKFPNSYLWPQMTCDQTPVQTLPRYWVGFRAELSQYFQVSIPVPCKPTLGKVASHENINNTTIVLTTVHPYILQILTNPPLSADWSYLI